MDSFFQERILIFFLEKQLELLAQTHPLSKNIIHTEVHLLRLPFMVFSGSFFQLRHFKLNAHNLEFTT